MTSHYLHVFLESLHIGSIIPLGHEPTFYAMQSFGGYNMELAFLMAVTGATLGQVFNWGVGHALHRIDSKKGGVSSTGRYLKARSLFQKYGIFLLLFAWAPLCNFLTVAAGFLAVRPKVALTLVLIGEAAHYGYALL